jgi:hypothetical protein
MTEYDAHLIRIIPPASTLYGLIQQISHRPGMYFEEKSMSALYNFIKGFEMACHVHGIDEKASPPFGEFHEFVRKKTSFSESTSGWRNMLLSFNSNDEEKALAMFFVLFEEFVDYHNTAALVRTND